MQNVPRDFANNRYVDRFYIKLKLKQKKKKQEKNIGGQV